MRIGKLEIRRQPTQQSAPVRAVNTAMVEEILISVQSVPAAICSQLGLDVSRLGDYQILPGQEAASYTVPVSKVSLFWESSELTTRDLEQALNANDPQIVITVYPKQYELELAFPSSNIPSEKINYLNYSATDRRRLLGFLAEVLRREVITDVSDTFTQVLEVRRRGRRISATS